MRKTGKIAVFLTLCSLAWMAGTSFSGLTYPNAYCGQFNCNGWHWWIGAPVNDWCDTTNNNIY